MCHNSLKSSRHGALVREVSCFVAPEALLQGFFMIRQLLAQCPSYQHLGQFPGGCCFFGVGSVGARSGGDEAADLAWI